MSALHQVAIAPLLKISIPYRLGQLDVVSFRPPASPRQANRRCRCYAAVGLGITLLRAVMRHGTLDLFHWGNGSFSQRWTRRCRVFATLLSSLRIFLVWAEYLAIQKCMLCDFSLLAANARFRSSESELRKFICKVSMTCKKLSYVMVRYYILPIYIPAFLPYRRKCYISSFLSSGPISSATPRGGPCGPLVDCYIYASHVAVEVALRSVATFSLSSIWFSSLWFLGLWPEQQPLSAEHPPMLYGMPL